MKALIFALAFLTIPLAVSARIIKTWSYQEMQDKADLVVIAALTDIKDTKESIVIWKPVTAVGVEANFKILGMFKGGKDIQTLVLHHYRLTDPGSGILDGPNYCDFDIKRDRYHAYLLFLVREPDGRYSSVTGQYDAAFGVQEVQGDAESRLMKMDFPNAISEGQAAEILRSTRPMDSPIFQMGLVDPIKKKAVMDLYDKQMAAILILAKSNNPGMATVLIPYLDYPAKRTPVPGVSLGARRSSKSLEQMRAEWPCFSTLLDIPNSSETLANYALDVRNPVDFRIATFHVLGFLDKAKFQGVSQVFDKEFADSDLQLKQYLKGIEEGKVEFEGVWPVDPKEN